MGSNLTAACESRTLDHANPVLHHDDGLSGSHELDFGSRYDELQREEEALHAKCRSLINSIALSLGEPHVAREHVRV